MREKRKAEPGKADKASMQERRTEFRMLCADMLDVTWTDRAGREHQSTALLEDISPSGACLQFESPIPPKTPIRLQCADRALDGKVCYCVYREIGYFVGVEFMPGNRWSRRNYEPQHFLDLQSFLSKKKTTGQAS
jgi:hypothetical protein